MNVFSGGENYSIFFFIFYLEEGGYVRIFEYDCLIICLNVNFNVNSWLILGGSVNVIIFNFRGFSLVGVGSIVNFFGFVKNIGLIYFVYVND